MDNLSYYILVGQRIRELRNSQYMSVDMLALLSGLSPTIICDYEDGAIPQTYKACQLIARALGVPLEDILISPDD